MGASKLGSKNRAAPSILDRGQKLPTYEDYPMPRGKLSRTNIQHGIDVARDTARWEGVDPLSISVIVDTSSTKPASYTDKVGCLTKSRGGGLALWSVQHGRRLNVKELMRLQGFDPTEVSVPITRNKFGALLGNAYTKTVFERVLECAINSAKLAARS